jgi:hypothetical protein
VGEVLGEPNLGILGNPAARAFTQVSFGARLQPLRDPPE